MARMLFSVMCLLVFVTQQLVHCHYCNSECQLPGDCTEIFQSGLTTSGARRIQPVGYSESFYVYCDMDTAGGGWTTFQRRQDGSVDFYRDWASYKAGFGNPNSEYWLGNENLFHLTAQGSYELRVDMEDFDGQTRYASYDNFRIGDEFTFYKLILGAYTGNAGDSLSRHATQPFSTYDADHDTWENNCASEYKGAWWYEKCHEANLNGAYLAGEHASYADGVAWSAWRGSYYSVKVTEMKIRRL